jgi:hypothetical protein
MPYVMQQMGRALCAPIVQRSAVQFEEQSGLLTATIESHRGVDEEDMYLINAKSNLSNGAREVC